jgi:hypothetical protein
VNNGHHNYYPIELLEIYTPTTTTTTYELADFAAATPGKLFIAENNNNNNDNNDSHTYDESYGNNVVKQEVHYTPLSPYNLTTPTTLTWSEIPSQSSSSVTSFY